MDSIEAFRIAQERRLSLASEVRAMGIDESFISTLVDTFYLRVQADPELGPVFINRIEDRWPVHLAKMKQFWESIAFRTSLYEGKPMETHQKLLEAKPEHFGIWLKLWEETLREIAPSQDAFEFLMDKARSMGKRLAKGRFGHEVSLE